MAKTRALAVRRAKPGPTRPQAEAIGSVLRSILENPVPAGAIGLLANQFAFKGGLYDPRAMHRTYTVTDTIIKQYPEYKRLLQPDSQPLWWEWTFNTPPMDPRGPGHWFWIGPADHPEYAIGQPVPPFPGTVDWPNPPREGMVHPTINQVYEVVPAHTEVTYQDRQVDEVGYLYTEYETKELLGVPILNVPKSYRMLTGAEGELWKQAEANNIRSHIEGTIEAATIILASSTLIRAAGPGIAGLIGAIGGKTA